MPADSDLAPIQELYDGGRYVDAWRAGAAMGELRRWPGVGGLVLAGRLASRLGAPGLSSRLFASAFRAGQHQPSAQYFWVSTLHEYRGAYLAWVARRKLVLSPHASDTDRGDYHGQSALLLGSLRDFARATVLMRQADDALPTRLYRYCEGATLCIMQDRYAQALATAEAGLAADDSYVPVILIASACLQLLGRQQDTLALLRRSAAAGQSGDVVASLIRVLLRSREFDEAEAAALRYTELTPLREPAQTSWLAMVRAEIASRRGDYRGALALIEQSTDPFASGIAENLRAFLANDGAVQPRRKELPVPFVRQHHNTCAPATLTSISQFWNRPAEHLSVAEQICYDGTPLHSERRWAESQGWVVREFRVDWASAVALIDRGLPFTLALQSVVMGHLVAAMGYDEATSILLARDPSTPETTEINAALLLDRRQSSGPRGMVMVPPDQASLLDGLQLPETELYDLLHRLQLALEVHDRPRALELQARMLAESPNHRLTLIARRAVAGYDANPREGLAALDALIEQFPADQFLLLARLGLLRQLATRPERVAWLASLADAPDTDPLLLLEYAVEVSADQRVIGRALALVRRALRRRRDSPQALYELSGIYWRQADRDEAVAAARFASCLEQTREEYARSYFEVCRWQRDPETALVYLRERVDRLGGLSANSAITLFDALELLDRTEEAFPVLESSIAVHPDDGNLRLFAANRYARYGQPEKSAARRAAAEGNVRRPDWLAEVSREARARGDRAAALAASLEIIATQPIDVEAQRMTATLRLEMGDRAAAMEGLQAACAAFPHNPGLRRLVYDFTDRESAAVREQPLRDILALDSADAWAHRELALNLMEQERFDAALAEADTGLALDPAEAASHSIRAHILNRMGRVTDAAAGFRDALGRSADNSDAIRGLLDTAGDLASRRSVLVFVESRLLEQTVLGQGLLTYRLVARGVLTPLELLGILRHAHEVRPDLWHAWSALGVHLDQMNQTEEAFGVVRAATERFPTVAQLWLQLGRLHRRRGDLELCIAALERCRALQDAGAVEATLEISDALVSNERIDDAVRILEAAIARAPLAAGLRGALAELFAFRRDYHRAVATMREAVSIDQGYLWGWQKLAEWSSVLGQASGALDLARSLAQARPAESAAWIRLSEMQINAGFATDGLDSADRAIAAAPRDEAAYDVRAWALARLRRFREADDACRPPVFGNSPPIALRARAAWVSAERGDVRGAIEQINKILAERPDYRWGWHRLLDWCASEDRMKEAIRAAEHLAWLEPANAIPLGWIGDLKNKGGDREGAKSALLRAMQLSPDYLFAGLGYFDIQCSEHRFEEATRTLEILSPFAAPGRILAAHVSLELARGKVDAALALVDELCGNPAHDASAVWIGANAVMNHGRAADLERTLRGVLAGQGWHPVTPVLWARTRTMRNRYGGIRDYPWLIRMGDAGRSAVCEILDGIGARAKAGPKTLWIRTGLAWQMLLIRHYCKAWRSDDRYWGKFGYALAARGKKGQVIRWQRDWRTRSEKESWMLKNLAIALFGRGRDKEGCATLQFVATQMAAVGAADQMHTLWCSLGALLDSDLPLADRILYEVPEGTVTPKDWSLWQTAVLVRAILGGPCGAAITADQRLAIDKVLSRLPDQTGKRLVLLSLYRAARYSGDLRLKLRVWNALHPDVLKAGSIIIGIALLRFFWGP
ncbi:MAG TPA: C39 family peptidase [Gemmatimonadales bacterium]